MEEKAQAAAKGAIFIRVLETWDTAAEPPGCGDGQGEHTMKEALKEAGGLEPGSETQLSLRTKPVKLLARIDEMAFTYYITTFWQHCLYSVPPETTPIVLFLPFQ